VSAVGFPPYELWLRDTDYRPAIRGIRDGRVHSRANVRGRKIVKGGHVDVGRLRGRSGAVRGVPAPDLERKDLLGARAVHGWIALWSVRKPQSLRRGSGDAEAVPGCPCS